MTGIMTKTYPHPSQLAPHQKPMLLIDKVISADAQKIRAISVVDPKGPFFLPGRGLPSYVGFEIMAQAVSVLDSLKRPGAAEGNPGKPMIGFLLGCRKYRAATEWFPAGEELEVEAVALIEDGDMRSFDCKVFGAGGQELCSGTLSVFRPSDPDAFLKGQAPS